jgi:hypothetical protein
MINDIMTSQCPYCQKEYIKKTLYEKHITICEIIQKIKKNDEEDELIPSTKILYKIVKELATQNKKLQDKVTELEKIIQRGVPQKKIDILERLNTNNTPSLPFQDWVRTLKITEEDISCLISENFSHVSNIILSRNIESYDFELPIVSNDLKKNIIYIYRLPNDNDEVLLQNNASWFKMENDDLLLIIKTLYQYILKCYHIQWKENNKHIHQFDEISGKILDKITNIKINNHADTHNRKIYHSLYNLVSKPI